ncbi:alpha/beta hydrolase [Streptomyces sp. ISL-66]|uniref:alpha/beta fold hydrolase n=1 Tax=Streptomyces sp. ISL-66 TaxID=2819186 RepID=UPI001BE894D6|nr:alpha/beta hydrolase [Streptomyces sp. ISL-66]MBT2468676.1 alpha/beta hydrolase [Streptomyces sp. ISL-66]
MPTTFTAPDGTHLAFHVFGESEPLLCLPGGPMCASSYLGDLGGLSKHRRLVVLDLRGTGDSALPADPGTYRCDRQIEDVEALRRHLGLERIDLLAHSASGDLALLYAARYPERIRSLVLVTARARALGVDFPVAGRKAAVELRAGEPWFESTRQAREAVWGGTATEADWDAMVPFSYGRWDAAARQHVASCADAYNDEAAPLFAADGAFDPESARAALAELAAPVLFVAGDVDTGPRPEAAREVAALFPHCEVVVQAGTAHYPWLDDAEAFKRTVRTFLDRV